MSLFKRLFGRSPSLVEPEDGAEEAPPAVPDEPQGFGLKCAWIAVATEDPEAVVDAMGLQRVRVTGWKAGIEDAYQSRIFVTPAIDGWVLAAGCRLPDPGGQDRPDKLSPWLQGIGERFEEVQYFGTHRVVEYQAWARLRSGRFARRFAYVGESGEEIWNDGEPSREERDFGLVFSGTYLQSGPWPDEADVLQLAGAWSLDPSKLEERGLPPSTGWCGLPPG